MSEICVACGKKIGKSRLAWIRKGKKKGEWKMWCTKQDCLRKYEEEFNPQEEVVA